MIDGSAKKEESQCGSGSTTTAANGQAFVTSTIK
jgi:hypothetical protein